MSEISKSSYSSQIEHKSENVFWPYWPFFRILLTSVSKTATYVFYTWWCYVRSHQKYYNTTTIRRVFIDTSCELISTLLFESFLISTIFRAFSRQTNVFWILQVMLNKSCILKLWNVKLYIFTWKILTENTGVFYSPLNEKEIGIFLACWWIYWKIWWNLFDFVLQ